MLVQVIIERVQRQSIVLDVPESSAAMVLANAASEPAKRVARSWVVGLWMCRRSWRIEPAWRTVGRVRVHAILSGNKSGSPLTPAGRSSRTPGEPP